jgi:predicted permease
MNIESKDMEISFLLAAMPASNSIIAFAVRYKTDPKLASTLVVTTNILSVITIPVMLLLLWGN